jgi:hypothetical protein
MKVMKASLLGIPIVSVAWIDACLAAKRVKVPTAEMYARTLSAKCSVATESAPSPRFEFGVALLAAAVNETSTKHSSKYALFPKDIMYLVGFSSQNEAAFCSLLRCAGVQDAIVSKQVALSKLKVMSKGNVDDTTRFVVLYAEDSVTCGFAIDPTSYVPKSGSLANEV